MISATGYAVRHANAPLEPFLFERRDPGPRDVTIAIEFCGVCHSDLHQARNDWGSSIYPMVPGHEIVGRVTAVGRAVERFAIGDLAGVGCIVDSCRACDSCRRGEEPYCDRNQVVYTSNSRWHDGTPTFGGYADVMVVDESFALRIPRTRDLAATAPLLCAGTTVYSVLRHWELREGQELAVVGLGGLGHLALKLAHALGAHVTQFTSSPAKAADARRLGAHETVIVRDAADLAGLEERFHLILDTIPASHDLNAYLPLLRRNGALVLVGLPAAPMPVSVSLLASKRRSLAGSLIGGIRQTQELLDYCAGRGIASEIELIRPDHLNTAWARLCRNDVRYRFVVDMRSLRSMA
jgi:alcohol dehydrogenase (NADP+)